MARYPVTISRESSVWGCAIAHDVELDGLTVGRLKNGGTVVFTAEEGTHVLQLVSSGKCERAVRISVGPDNPALCFMAVFEGVSQHIKLYPYEPQDGFSQLPVPGERSRTPNILLGVIVCFAVLCLVAVLFWGNLGEDSPSSRRLDSRPVPTSTFSPEEEAARMLQDASDKFSAGNYVKAFELCHGVTEQYPETNIAQNMGMYIEERLEQFPRISAKALMQEYQDNVVNADKEYTDTVMIVSGAVTSIGKTNGDSNLTVSLESGTYLCSVQLNFKTDQEDYVASLSEGDPVEVIGKCTGQSGKVLVVLDGSNVMIEDCIPLPYNG